MLAAALAFTAAALLLTLTPGLDTMFVVRTSLASGPRVGLAGGAGISLGTLTWGAASAAGVTALLVASHLAYTALRVTGAAYLTYVGVRMLWQARSRHHLAADEPAAPGTGWLPGRRVAGAEAFRTGLLTNLLNPKVGVFYVTLLPQFIPAGTGHVAAFAFSMALATIHVVEGMLWFAVLTASLVRVRRLLSRPRLHRLLDRLTGLVFIGFGARLALEGHRMGAG